MDYNQLAADIINELKKQARRTDAEIAQRLGISRQAYVRRRDNNTLTTEDITILSAWLITAFGGGFYINKYFLNDVGSPLMTTQNSAMGDEELHTKLDDMLSNFLHDYRQGYDNSKEQGLNLEYCTFDSIVAFLDGIKELIKSRDQQIALAARLDERKQVALDNYYGHTFSEETNYKGKFDKLIENNERRITNLKRSQNKEK